MITDNYIKETIFVLRIIYPEEYKTIYKTLFDTHFNETIEYDKLLTYYARDVINKRLPMTTLGDMFKDNDKWALRLYCYTGKGRYKLDISFTQILKCLHEDIFGNSLVKYTSNALDKAIKNNEN